MADHRISPPLTDKSVKLDGNDRGTKGHYSGEEYDSSTQDQPRFGEIGAGRNDRETNPTGSKNEVEEDIPPEVGRRAFIDKETGEVHGSGAGAGGGLEGEDYDSSLN